jgi:hypothetical protein
MSFFIEQAEYRNTIDKYFGPAVADRQNLERLVIGIIVSSVCTFAISFSTAWCVRITGPTTYRYLKY